MNWIHELPVLFVPYALTTAGVLAGLLFGCAAVERIVIAPLTAIPTSIIAALLLNEFIEMFGTRLLATGLIAEPYLAELFGFSGFLIVGVIAGRLTAKFPTRPVFTRLGEPRRRESTNS